MMRAVLTLLPLLLLAACDTVDPDVGTKAPCPQGGGFLHTLGPEGQRRLSLVPAPMLTAQWARREEGDPPYTSYPELAFFPDGRRLLDGRYVLDAATGARLATLGDGFGDHRISSDGQTVIYARTPFGELAVPEGGRVEGRRRLASTVYIADARTYVSSAVLRDTTTFVAPRRYRLGAFLLPRVVPGEDSLVVARVVEVHEVEPNIARTAWFDRVVSAEYGVWKAHVSGAGLRLLVATANAVSGLDVAPSGREVAVASMGILRLYEARSGALLTSFGNNGPSNSLRYNAGGNVLYSPVFYDALLDRATGTRVQLRQWATAVGVSADGRTAYSGNEAFTRVALGPGVTMGTPVVVLDYGALYGSSPLYTASHLVRAVAVSPVDGAVAVLSEIQPYEAGCPLPAL